MADALATYCNIQWWTAAHMAKLDKCVEDFVISNLIYKNGEKTEIRNPFFHSVAARFKKNAVFENCEFSKRARNT